MIITILVLLFIIAITGMRIVPQYRRLIVLSFGKYSRTLGPGLNWILPLVETTIPVDIRIQTSDIPSQNIMTKDNVPVTVNGVVYFRVENPEKAVLDVKDYYYATSTYAQTVLRDVVSQHDLDDILQHREKMAVDIRKIVDERVKDWGIDITDLKIQDIVPDSKIKVAMARQAEAEREKRAIIIKASGEVEASKMYVEAAKSLGKDGSAVYLRTLHFLNDIAESPSQKILFVPIEMMKWFERKK